MLTILLVAVIYALDVYPLIKLWQLIQEELRDVPDPENTIWPFVTR